MVALTVGFLEQLVVFERAFGGRGPFSAAMAGVFRRFGARNPFFSRMLRLILVTGAAAGFLGALSGPYPPVGRVSGVCVLACVAAVRLRRVTASDGAEQMAILTLLATCIAVLPGVNHTAITFAVWFIAGQAILSYVTAGVTKAVSTTWRNGDAIPLIMSSESHGQPWVADIFRAYPGLGRLLTRFVILFECAFPLILVGPAEIGVGLLAIGFAFHLGCAVAMGLNAFLLAFPGSYVCVAYVAYTTSPYW
jgi:hypothetical protein